VHRRLLTVAVVGLAVLGLAACQPQSMQQAVTVPAQVCDTAFRVVNQSSGTVSQLYFSHSSLSSFGPDQLGQSVLPPGRAVRYRAANAGNYDFRAVWTNGRRAELMGVDICRANQITVTDRGLIAS
jgi:hypothetical protein